MTQKDNVKQLIGKSLNAYNNKVLQQIDRIEKKNKQQNHKISMLTNELDNDYLTKTEEGSVISLDHSKEGMVYIDSLEGNTLVNYCTDGAKELTLNGDIDLEGTFVTTTEGVENGLVDVMCEGNTLVNLSNTKEVLNKNKSHYDDIYLCELSRIKPNVSYTVIYDFECNIDFTFDTCYVGYSITTPSVMFEQFSGNRHYAKKGKNIMCFNLTIEQYNVAIEKGAKYFQIRVFIDNEKKEKQYSSKNIMLLEGDWTDKEIPPYFEGMKSVGQDDENGHKIEILSQNKNLFEDNVINQTGKGNGANGTLYPTMFNNSASRCRSADLIKVKPNTDYYFSSKDKFWFAIAEFDSNNKQILENGWTISPSGGVHRTSSNCESIVVIIRKNNNSNINPNEVYGNIQIEEGSIKTDYIQRDYNKKEILLNEPLRGLPNGVKDRFVKIGGKFYIERNCGGKIITKDTTKFSLTHVTTTTNLGIGLVINKTLELADCFRTTADNFLLEGFVNGKSGQWYEKHWGAYSNDMNIVAVFPPTYTLDQMKDFIDGKQIIYKLKTPTYEPLEINPELICYNDTTHISNNSIIPCNMKVQNSGYNAIIKPSTLYTVALDTNKSGTIGMNLGGVKGTTTNNVLTLTTPATLTDDSLRLHGKGIKGSKVRLLEGDKNNWIPSYFEGMKSSFEDKFDATDNTYKMEILSNNKNYFNYKGELNQYYKGMSIGTEVNINTLQSDGGIFSNLFTANHHGRGQIIKVKPYTNYIIKSTVVNSGRININTPSMVNFEYGTALNGKLNKTFNTLNNNEICLSFHTSGNSSHPNAIFYDVELILESNDNLDYIPNKSNKIQFSSIEPLRSVEDTKDKFVFKDGKLMIERNCKKIIVDNNLSWVGFDTSVTPNHPRAYFLLDDYKLNKRSHCDGFGFINADKEFRHFKAHPFGSEGVKTIVWFYVEKAKLNAYNQQGFLEYFKDNTFVLVYPTKEPTYEEVPHELQKIILEGYENGTLFFDTNIPPTSTVRYAGETPIVKVTKLNKTKVLKNTNDINDNIVPYLMDMDYRVVCLELATETQGISMAKLFGGVYEMLKRDILSKRLTKEEYGYRLTDYFNAGKLTEEQVRELEDLR